MKSIPSISFSNCQDEHPPLLNVTQTRVEESHFHSATSSPRHPSSMHISFAQKLPREISVLPQPFPELVSYHFITVPLPFFRAALAVFPDAALLSCFCANLFFLPLRTV